MCGNQHRCHAVRLCGSGGATGADLILEALLGTIFVLTANTLLRPVVNRINRQPDDTLKRGDDQYGLCNHQT
ncbi:hypothetical protein SAMN05216299_11215 [Nitrosospira sp. Nsp14]|uniref:hypothetical protein n=1 Tax=Nitrosospira sp. Nsp14 TaxID=1855333 RepID=UPI0008F13392|nr:hypothetical protein [Nitrosospira sp. Nsp14]SFH42642.1 hypothetical protein SAMN05216299_11215 [Nitrosospira sp. Nsp14]